MEEMLRRVRLRSRRYLSVRDEMRPVFEKNIICPTCGELSVDKVLLTELSRGA